LAHGILILRDSNNMEPCEGVQSHVIVDELVERFYIEETSTYTLCFIGCGEAVWETQVWWHAIKNKYNIVDTVFLDRVITSSAIANIQSAFSSFPSSSKPPAIIFSFDDLTNYIETQSKMILDRKYIIIGIHAAMHFDTPKDVHACIRCMNLCMALHAHCRVHPQFLNFFVVSPFNKHFPCCKTSSTMCLNATCWSTLSTEIFAHWNATRCDGSPLN
jgi:hypothetical protein